MISSRKTLLKEAEVELIKIRKESKTTPKGGWPTIDDKSKWYNNLGYFFGNKKRHEEIIRELERYRITEKEIMNYVKLMKKRDSSSIFQSGKNTISSMPLYKKAREKYESNFHKWSDKKRARMMQKFEENLLGRTPRDLFFTYNMIPEDIVAYIAKTGRFPKTITDRDYAMMIPAARIYVQERGGKPMYPDWKSSYSWKETLKDIGLGLLRIAAGGPASAR